MKKTERYSTVSFWVPGIPEAQGSMRSPRAGVVLHNKPSLTAWRDLIGFTAKQAWGTRPLLDWPVRMTCAFYFPKPQRPQHDGWASTSLDLDKLIRAVGDALQGVVLKNDSRIVAITAQKRWAGGVLGPQEPGLSVRLETCS